MTKLSLSQLFKENPKRDNAPLFFFIIDLKGSTLEKEGETEISSICCLSPQMATKQIDELGIELGPSWGAGTTSSGFTCCSGPKYFLFLKKQELVTGCFFWHPGFMIQGSDLPFQRSK